MALTYHQLRLDLAAALAVFLDPEEAHAECRRWFEEGLDLSRSWMAAHGTEPVPPQVHRRVSAWIRRRRKGEPWAYILGWSLFRDRRFKVTPDEQDLPSTCVCRRCPHAVGRRIVYRLIQPRT